MIAEIYYNLINKRWGVKHKGQVVHYRNRLSLKDCVSSAFSRPPKEDPPAKSTVIQLYYNPLKTPSFQVIATDEALLNAESVLINNETP